MSSFNDHLDELASAYIDDELSPDERAEVESNPAAMARVRVFESVQLAVARPVPELTEDLRERGLAEAMNAPAMTAPAVPIAHRDHRRRYRQSRWQWGAGIGAAAAVIALLVVVVASSSRNSHDDASTASATLAAASATDQAGGSSGAEKAAGPAPTADLAAPTAPLRDSSTQDQSSHGSATTVAASGTSDPFAASAPPQLGAFTDTDAVARASEAMAPAPTSEKACDGQVVASLLWNNEPARLVQRTDDSRVVVAPDCFVLAFVPRSVPPGAP